MLPILIAAFAAGVVVGNASKERPMARRDASVRGLRRGDGGAAVGNRYAPNNYQYGCRQGGAYQYVPSIYDGMTCAPTAPFPAKPVNFYYQNGADGCGFDRKCGSNCGTGGCGYCGWSPPSPPQGAPVAPPFEVMQPPQGSPPFEVMQPQPMPPMTDAPIAPPGGYIAMPAGSEVRGGCGMPSGYGAPPAGYKYGNNGSGHGGGRAQGCCGGGCRNCGGGPVPQPPLPPPPSPPIQATPPRFPPREPTFPPRPQPPPTIALPPREPTFPPQQPQPPTIDIALPPREPTFPPPQTPPPGFIALPPGASERMVAGCVGGGCPGGGKSMHAAVTGNSLKGVRFSSNSTRFFIRKPTKINGYGAPFQRAVLQRGGKRSELLNLVAVFVYPGDIIDVYGHDAPLIVD